MLKKITKLKSIQFEQIGNFISIEGPLGFVKLIINPAVTVQLDTNEIILTINHVKYKSFLFLFFNLIKQKMKGVLQGFKKKIYLKGIGFKFLLENNQLILKVGYSHLIYINIPNNIKLTITKSIYLILFSIDYNLLTQFISSIKKRKKIEPYKGKGILSQNEKIKYKEGKKKKN